MQNEQQLPKTYAVLGGTSGMGLALAERLTQRGDQVVIGGRDPARLSTALAQLGPRARGIRVDVTQKADLIAFFEQTGPIDGLFTPAADYQVGSFQAGDLAQSEGVFAGKFWPQYWAVHAALPVLRPDAAVVLMSGAASVRPIGAAAYAACNAALEGLARGLAIELSPIRVNCLSPGTTDSALWRNRPVDQRAAAYGLWQNLCLVKRPGTVEEQAHAALFLLDNTNMTGSTLYCDGGYSLR